MAKDPAFLFYSQDFLTGTYTMTDEQVGKYIRLLCLQHQKGHLSEKDMLKICSGYDEDIFCKFKKTDEGFYNERLKTEAEKRSAFAESRRNNRKKKENQDINNISKSYDKHMENENENENENEVENVNENENEKLILQFDEFRKAYPGVKRGLETELKTLKKHKDWKTIIPQLEQSLKSQHFAREENRKKGNFVPDWKHLQTYINQRSWEEEIIINQNTNNNGKTGNNSRGGTGAGFDLKKAFAYVDEMYARREAGSNGDSTGGEDDFDF